MGADAEIFLFDHDRYRDQVVPALTELLRTGTVVPWLDAVFASATPMGEYGYDVLWRRLAERLREQPVDVARDWPWLGSDLRYVGARPRRRALGRHVGRPSGDDDGRGSGRLPRAGEPVVVEELNALHEALVALYCLGPGQFLGRSVTPDFYLPVLDGQGVGAGDPVRGLLAALSTRGAVLGDQFGVTEGIHGWLDVPETAELAVRLGRLDLPRYEPTLAAMADHAKRGGYPPGEWREMSLSFVRTMATIAADDGRAVLWGNDVSPDTWRGVLGAVA
ncbi:hypothetical protein ACFOOK_12675 [Micromonospora krabiensis]|uniref:Uncharacterized protein n=1 Tax=Micromonospora krabiensis TaxID=307121 RepID=A0A1C3N2C6_9ACTN|nr:hypothetical protein [Micromonospora krabiensis]SBV26711.1 hypothetical protein GA0070620_2205 [Micromonospora krabiensis]